MFTNRTFRASAALTIVASMIVNLFAPAAGAFAYQEPTQPTAEPELSSAVELANQPAEGPVVVVEPAASLDTIQPPAEPTQTPAETPLQQPALAQPAPVSQPVSPLQIVPALPTEKTGGLIINFGIHDVCGINGDRFAVYPNENVTVASDVEYSYDGSTWMTLPNLVASPEAFLGDASQGVSTDGSNAIYLRTIVDGQYAYEYLTFGSGQNALDCTNPDFTSALDRNDEAGLNSDYFTLPEGLPATEWDGAAYYVVAADGSLVPVELGQLITLGDLGYTDFSTPYGTGVTIQIYYANSNWDNPADAVYRNATVTFTNEQPERQETGQIVFEKRDQDGNLLPGGIFAGQSCTKFDNDPDWTCTSLNDYRWFRDGMTLNGFADRFAQDIEMEGGWELPVMHCIILTEMTAPAGYADATNPTGTFCKGPGGWTAANAEGAFDGPTGAGDWTAVNDPENLNTTIMLVNHLIDDEQPTPPVDEETPPIDEDTPPTTTDPVTPAPSDPNVLGASIDTPGTTTPVASDVTELPHTGTTGSLIMLYLGAFMALLTYGAVYLAQPRRELQ